MKRMMGVLVASLAMAVFAQGLSAQVARNLTGTWNIDAQTDPASVRGPSAGLIRTAYTGSFVVAHDGSYTFTATGTVDSQAVTADGSISDIYVGFMVNGYKLGQTMPTTSFYFNGSLNAALDTITGSFFGFAQDGTRWGGLFNLRFLPAVVNFPPLIFVTPDPTGMCFAVGDSVNISIVAPDPDPEDVVAIAVYGLPPGLVATSYPGNAATATIWGRCEQKGIFPVTLVAVDDWGNTASLNVKFEVCEIMPEFPSGYLGLILPVDGKEPRHRCTSRVGVTATLPEGWSLNSKRVVTLRIHDTTVAKFKGSDEKQVSENLWCTLSGAFGGKEIEAVSVGETDITVSVDGLPPSTAKVRVASFRPKVDWATIPAKPRTKTPKHPEWVTVEVGSGPSDAGDFSFGSLATVTVEIADFGQLSQAVDANATVSVQVNPKGAALEKPDFAADFEMAHGVYVTADANGQLSGLTFNWFRSASASALAAELTEPDPNPVVTIATDQVEDKYGHIQKVDQFGPFAGPSAVNEKKAQWDHWLDTVEGTTYPIGLHYSVTIDSPGSGMKKGVLGWYMPPSVMIVLYGPDER